MGENRKFGNWPPYNYRLESTHRRWRATPFLAFPSNIAISNIAGIEIWFVVDAFPKGLQVFSCSLMGGFSLSINLICCLVGWLFFFALETIEAQRPIVPFIFLDSQYQIVRFYFFHLCNVTHHVYTPLSPHFFVTPYVFFEGFLNGHP